MLKFQIRIDATLIEYFDDRAFKFISEKFPETPDGMAGAIFFEQETTAENEDALLEQWNELLEKHDADLERSWFTTNEQDREKMRAFRHALPVAVNERIAKYKQRKVGTDMAVPDAEFSVISEILQRYARCKRARLCDFWPYRRLSFAREYAAEK